MSIQNMVGQYTPDNIEVSATLKTVMQTGHIGHMPGHDSAESIAKTSSVSKLPVEHFLRFRHVGQILLQGKHLRAKTVVF